MRYNLAKKYSQKNVQKKVCVEFDKIGVIISIMKLEGFEENYLKSFF